MMSEHFCSNSYIVLERIYLLSHDYCIARACNTVNQELIAILLSE